MTQTRSQTHSQTPAHLDTAKARIATAFKEGQTLTSFLGNKIGRTVDFRKIVSILRDEGMAIKDCWVRAGKAKFKLYYLETGANTETLS